MTSHSEAWMRRVRSRAGPLLVASDFLVRWGVDRFRSNRLACRAAVSLGVLLLRLDRLVWSAFRV
jgi:hypothetical protein